MSLTVVRKREKFLAIQWQHPVGFNWCRKGEAGTRLTPRRVSPGDWLIVALVDGTKEVVDVVDNRRFREDFEGAP